MSKVLLKDVVYRVKDKVDKDNTDLEYYIGGEHFDNGEVTVTKRALIYGSTIGPAFHMRFMPGDVLLMSRNPHLRKAGQVNFEGLCSDVSYVCRTKDENVLMQDFLPFIFQSEPFWEFAEAHKKGSTNFFLNWSDFEKYEFFLPTIEDQQRLTELFWGIEAAKSAYRNLIKATDDIVKSQFIELFGDAKLNPYGFPKHTLSEYVEFLTSGSRGWAKYCVDDGHEWFITIKNVKDCHISLENMQAINAPDNAEAKRTRVQEGDLLISITADLGRTGVVSKDIADHGAYINQHLTCIRLNKEVLNPLYVAYFMESPAGKEQFAAKNQNAVKAGLNFDSINSLQLLVPPMELQEQFIAFVKQVDKSKLAAQETLNDIINVEKNLLQKILVIHNIPGVIIHVQRRYL